SGAIAALDGDDRAALFGRAGESAAAQREQVARIIDRVRRDGDAALAALALELDGVALESLEVPRARWREALAGLEPPLRSALEVAGVDRLFALGGAGASAAMAFGTTTVPRVDRIVGPGNAWVMEAKLQVTGACSIDSPAGPSELLVIADDGADPDAVAGEL